MLLIMSPDYYRKQITQHRDQIARLQHEKSSKASKAADARKRAAEANSAAARASSASTRASKLRDIERYERDAASFDKDAAGIESKIAAENMKIVNLEKSLSREIEREESDRRRNEEQRRRDDERRQRELDRARIDQQSQVRRQENKLRNMDQQLGHHAQLHQETITAIQRLAQLPETISVLFLASNPLDQQALRLDEEARAIGEMIRKSKHRDSVKLESRWAARPLDLLQAINEIKPRIVHFSGHGSDTDELVFQDNQGHTKLVTKEAIVQTIAACGGIDLLFFNACFSKSQAEAVVRYVPAAIGMNSAIGDDAARVFAAQFYSAIGFGLSVQKAFDQAKAALMLENIPEEDTPELLIGDGVDANELILVKPD
jgi:hypothetical protein